MEYSRWFISEILNPHKILLVVKTGGLIIASYVLKHLQQGVVYLVYII
jgi:hypothetical protein